MSKRMYPQYPAAQQSGTNYTPSSNVPGQLPPSSYGPVGSSNYPYQQQHQLSGQPTGMGGSAMQGQIGQYPQAGTAGVQQMRIPTQGQVRAQQPPSISLGSQQPLQGPSTGGMSSVPLNPLPSSQPQPPQTMLQQTVPRPQGHGIHPPATSQTTGPPSRSVAGPPPVTASQMYKTTNPSLPPPPNPGLPYRAAGTTQGQQTVPPPPVSGQQPFVGQPGLDLRQPPPNSAQLPSGLQFQTQPTPGQPPHSVQAPGQTYPAGIPPPTGGQAPPSATGPSLPPPPMAGQPYQPPVSFPPPPQQIAPPPPGQGLMAGPVTGSHLGQRPSGAPGVLTQPGPASGPGQGLMAGPVTGSHLGQRPPGAPGVLTQPGSASGPGGPVPPPGGTVVNDPNLQPVNLMESRDILPSTPLEPPRAVLPGNQSRYSPSPSVFCCTMNAIPASSGLLNKMKLPLAIHIHPYKEMPHNECPVMHPSIIVRCRMCRTYLNPFATFIDSRHWRCNLCFRPNSLPEDFDFNSQTGKHGDRSHRLELKRSSVEYIAPSEYMVRPPQPSVYYFLIDVSFNTIERGLLGVICRTLLDNLDRLPGDARTMIGILTFDSTLHFYKLKSTLSQPQMLVVSELDDVFLPSPDSLIVNLKESKELVRTLLEDLPGMFAGNKNVQCALGPALQAATKLLHPIGGRVSVIVSTLPNIGPGALKYRDVSPSSMKMDSLNMSPASDFYKKLALECSSQQIGVDLFTFSSQFTDLPTISCISKFSAGHVSYYPDFHHTKEIPRQKFERDFKRYLTRKIGYEAVMRIRCTDGLSLHTFHGNFFVRSTDLLSLPNVNPDHGYTINISIDENLKDMNTVCFQAALLYTSSRGERRIRVHTLCLPVATQLPQIYAKLNVQAITGVLANMAVDRSSSATLGDAREALMNVSVDATKVYRANCASSMQASQFILPSSIRLLPLFVLSLVKNPAFTLTTKVTFDARTQAMNFIKTLPLDYLMCRIYPRLFALHLLTEKDISTTEDGREIISPPILRLSAEKMTRYGIFLMDYGLGMYIWVCKDSPQELIQKIFGVPHFGAIPEVMIALPTLENEMSTLVRKLVKQVRLSRQHFMPLQVIREDGPERLLYIDKLIEDRTEHGTAYYELLTHLNRQLGK